MAATDAQHRRVTLASTALVSATALAVALAGCGGDGGGDQSELTPSPPVTGTPGVDEVGTPTDTGYPTTVQEYAEVTIAAWAAPDLIRLAELTTEPVHDQIVEFPGPPNLEWTFILCEADGEGLDEEGLDEGPSSCSFHNADGDHLWLQVDGALLAGPGAVVAVDLEVTTYPADAREYVEAFVAAWLDGNPPRVANLAVPEAADAMLRLLPEPVADYDVSGAQAELATVVIVLTDVEIETQVSTALLGEPQAIRQAEVQER